MNLDYRAKAFSFSPLSMLLAVSLPYMALIMFYAGSFST